MVHKQRPAAREDVAGGLDHTTERCCTFAHRWHTVGTQLARANFSFGARHLPYWRTPNQDMARQLTTWRTPKPCLARACSFLRPLAALTLTPLALFRPPALGVKQVRNQVLVQQALQLREGGLFDPHVDGHMALGAESRVQLHRRHLQVQHMVGVGTTLSPPPPLHAPAPWRSPAAANPPSAFPTPSPAAATRPAHR